MIKLYVFPSLIDGLPDVSSFVTKLETALRLGGLAYERVEVGNPAQGPKGKLPFVELENGEVIGDSTLILERLKETHGLDLDDGLNPREKAISHAVQRMIEERLYWVLVYSRWIEPVNQWFERDLFFGQVPVLIRPIIYRSAVKTVTTALHHHGLGRHSREEIYALGTADIDALATLLADQPFLFGEAPSLVDATAFAILVNIVTPAVESPLKQAVKAYDTLLHYTARMMDRFDQADRRLSIAAE